MKTKTLLVILCWFVVVAVAAKANFFIGPAGQPPLAIGIAFAGPLLGFLAIFAVSRNLRAAASRLSPVFLASLHGWRFVGLGFIAAFYRDLLPPGFAWPAGIGDITVAALAPYIVYRLATDTSFIRSGAFVAWNIFGVIDFLTAVGLGTAHQAAPGFFHATVDTGMMQELPFVLIPCFFVPLLGMTHIVMLHQALRQRTPATTLPRGELSRAR